MPIPLLETPLAINPQEVLPLHNMDIGFLSWKFLNNTLEAWLYALLVFFISLQLFLLIRRFIGQRLESWLKKSSYRPSMLLGELLSRTRILPFLGFAIFWASGMLTLSPVVAKWMPILPKFAFIIQVLIWGNAAINWYVSYNTRLKLEDDAINMSFISAISVIGRILLWTGITLTLLDLFGVNVTGLVAGLGIGGVAVAFAAQNILGDLLASFFIMFDRPFAVGDFIILDAYMGTVEQIGMRTTRLRSLGGEEIILANADVVKSRIRNYKQMRDRRVLFKLGVSYDTPYEQLERVPKLIRDIIRGQKQTRFDRAHVSEFGQASLIIEVVYFVLSPDYNVYMDIHQKIMLEIIHKLRDEQIRYTIPS